MKQAVTIHEFYDILENSIKDFPETMAEHVFHWTKSPFFLLISTVLSARSLDKLTLTRLPGLWEVAKTPQELLEVPPEKLEKLIYPIGFYKTKAKHLRALSEMLIDTFHGKVPQTMEELLTLPGVGRKTANLELAIAFNIPAICVDTHVHRIMNHIGYVHTKTPEQTEMALRKKLPKDLWLRTNRILVSVGQNLANYKTINDPHNILNQYTIKA